MAPNPGRSPRGAARERALDYVKRQILAGVFRGGELITEGEVAGALDMSRTPVREAFLRLEADGLLKLYPQRGALVVPVSPAEVHAVMESRLVLEQFAAEKVIGYGDSRRALVAKAMREQITRQQEARSAGQVPEFLDADRAFHAVLLQNADNEILADLYGSLRDRQLRMIGESAVRDPGRMTTILAEHEHITAALESGDLAVTVEAIRHHLTGTSLALGMSPQTDRGPGLLPH